MTVPARRRAAIVAILAAILLAAAYTAYWFHAAGVVGKGLEEWAAARRTEGWQVTWQRLSVGGYPLHVTARLDHPSLTTPSGIAWQAEVANASTSPFDLGHVTLSAPGRHRVSAGPVAAAFTAQELTGDLGFDLSGRLEEIRAHAHGLTVDGGDGGAQDLTASASRLDPAAPVTEKSPVLAFSAAATGLELPEWPGLVLGRRIASAQISGRVLGPVPQSGSALEVLDGWSGNGGTVAIDHLSLDWDPMALEADGTVAFDPAMQPLAAFSARVRGYTQLMDRLETSGVVAPGAAEAGKIMLSLLARRDSQGRPAVPVPVTVQDGRLWLGPAKVAAIPPIPWPYPARNAAPHGPSTNSAPSAE